MTRIAVLPPVAVALGGGAAVLFVLLTAGAPAGPALWAVVAGALALAVMAVAAAAVAARRAAHSVAARVEVIRRRVAEQTEERRAAAGEPADPEAVDGVGGPASAPVPRAPAADAFGGLAEDLERVHRESLEVLSRLASATDSDEAPTGGGDRGTGVEHRIEVFVNVARRLQSLAHREIAVLDELEREIEDPDLLRGLFHVDHLATRVRRHAENLAVLGGAVSRRQWSEPVPLEEVLRSAVAEVEQYARVRVVPPVEGTLRGHAVADVIHLLAELVENATVFSPPHTQVAIRADAVAAGLAVEVEDRGLGMPAEEQERMNALLADPASVDVAGLLADGRIGLYVVSQLARRHGVRVRLGGNIYGGVQAVLVLPQELLGPRPTQLPPAAEDAPADPPTAGGPAGAGEWGLSGPAVSGPAVSGRGGHGPSPVVEPEPEPEPEPERELELEPEPHETVLFAPRPAGDRPFHGDTPVEREPAATADLRPTTPGDASAVEWAGAGAGDESGGHAWEPFRPTDAQTIPRTDLPVRPEAAWGPASARPVEESPTTATARAVGDRPAPPAPARGTGARPLGADTVRPVPAAAPPPDLPSPQDRALQVGMPWGRDADGAAGPAELSHTAGAGHLVPEARDLPGSAHLPAAGPSPTADTAWNRASQAGREASHPLAPTGHAVVPAPDGLTGTSGTPPHGTEPWRAAQEAADVPAPPSSGSATPRREAEDRHLDQWAGDVVARPADVTVRPEQFEEPAPHAPDEDSPARSGPSAPGAMPEAWRQATRGAGETKPLVPSPRPGEHVAPHTEPRAPLPLRERGGRATPAGALPGMRPAAPAGDATGPEVLTAQMPSAAVPPPLPRRRAQSHLAPQLRSRPAPRPEADATEEEAGHDPHLMAAFRRGVGLAEAHDADFPDADVSANGSASANANGSGDANANGSGDAPADTDAATPADADL